MQMEITGWKRVLVNACVTGIITTASVLMAAPGANYEGAFMVSAILAGIVSGAREIKDICDIPKKPITRMKSIYSAMSLF